MNLFENILKYNGLLYPLVTNTLSCMGNVVKVIHSKNLINNINLVYSISVFDLPGVINEDNTKYWYKHMNTENYQIYFWSTQQAFYKNQGSIDFNNNMWKFNVLHRNNNLPSIVCDNIKKYYQYNKIYLII